VTVTPGGFPESPQKGFSSKAPVAAPAGDPDSSSSDSDDMSDHGEGAGGSGPEPVPEPLPRLSIKVPSSKKFTDDGEDLKPEAFDRWYNSVQLYLRLKQCIPERCRIRKLLDSLYRRTSPSSGIPSGRTIWRKPHKRPTSNLSQGTIPIVQA